MLPTRPTSHQPARRLDYLRRSASIASVATALLLGSTPAHAQVQAPRPWDNLTDNIATAFSGSNLLWHGGAVASSIALAESEFDYDIRVLVQRKLRAPAYADTCLYGGFVLPVVLAPTIYLVGLTTRNRKVTYAGAAAVQALAITGATTGLLKWTTGRPYPNNGRSPDDPYKLTHREDGRISALNPFDSNVFMAWPSGHTSSTMSIAAALYGFAPEQTWLLYAGYPLALGIGFGMVVGDHHWASDVVAGAMLGHAVGSSIGKQFRRRHDGDAQDKNQETVRVQGFTAFPYAGGLSLGVYGVL